MRKKIRFLTVLTIFVVMLAPVMVFAVPSLPSIPLLVYGNVSIDGQPAPLDTEISAEIEEAGVAIATMIKQGLYFIGVPDGKANEGKMITFKVNGITNNSQLQSVNIDTTPSINFDLAVATTRSCAISNGQGIQTWDGSGWEDCLVESCNSGYHQSGNSCAVDSSGEDSGGGGGSSGGGGGSSGGGGGGGYTPPTTPPPAIQGDTNNDSKVDKYDFALMMAAWGKTGTNSSDLNGDDKIDKYDFALLMLNWSGV